MVQFYGMYVDGAVRVGILFSISFLIFTRLVISAFKERGFEFFSYSVLFSRQNVNLKQGKAIFGHKVRKIGKLHINIKHSSALSAMKEK